jgi:hypothetical protein
MIRLFTCDPYFEAYNFPMLFHGNPKTIFYMFISKDSTTWINKCKIKNCISYNENVFQNNENFNTFYIVFYIDSYIKRKIISSIFTTNDVSKNVNLYKISDLGYK